MESELQRGVDSTLTYPVLAIPAAPDTRVATTEHIEVTTGRGLAALRLLEKHWRALAASLPQASFIHAFDWQYAYLKHLETNPESTHYVSFFDRGRAIAIFPLRRVRRSVGRIRLWQWELPTHPHLALADPLLSPEWDSAALIRRLIGTLNTPPFLPWNTLHFPNLLDDSVTVRSRLTESLPWMHMEKTEQSMYFRCTDLPTTLARCSSQFKRNLRRQGKRLAERGIVTLSIARRGQELDAAYTDFLRLEAAGWKGKTGQASAIALHPGLLGFYSELKERFAATEDCLIALLNLDGVAIAAQFGLIAGDTLYIPKLAYDETYSAEAPGNQLMYKLLDYCCREPGIDQLSLVTSPAWAKSRWNGENRDVWEAYVFKPGLRSLSGLLMRRFKRQVWEPTMARWQRIRQPAATGASE